MRSMRWSICIATLMCAVTAGAWGQTAAPGGAEPKAEAAVAANAAYEVVTIKPSSPGGRMSGRTMPNGEYFSTGMALQGALWDAYEKFPFQIVGVPAWLSSDKYDIQAKPDEAMGEQFLRASREERRKMQNAMLQHMLEDRLKLKVHEETREMPIFALVIAKGGLKMHEATPQEGAGPVAYSFSVGNGKMTARGISMEQLVRNLTGNLDHIVKDRTGLAGVYDFTLSYSNDLNADPDSSAPSIYTALQEQLGLKLEPEKGPVDVLVIDHVERPSEN